MREAHETTLESAQSRCNARRQLLAMYTAENVTTLSPISQYTLRVGAINKIADS